MLSKQTVSSFKSLIFLECFFCINRSYLFDNIRVKTICDFIFSFITLTVVSIIPFDIFSNPEVKYGLLAFQGFITIELLGLAIAALCFRKHFNALLKLDEKFGLDDDCCKKIKDKADAAAIAIVFSMLIDVGVLTMLSARPGLTTMICLGAAAHDSELALISLYIKVINIRLAKSITVNPNYGCTVYRHILIATSYFNEGFKFSILLMCIVTLFTTIIYGIVIILLDSDMVTITVSYLAWREFKSLYSLWLVCSAAYETEKICKRLALHVTSKLVLDKNISNGKPLESYQTLNRWHASMISLRPRFNAGQGIDLSLRVPVAILDVSINYMLLILQFYKAYK